MLKIFAIQKLIRLFLSNDYQVKLFKGLIWSKYRNKYEMLEHQK